MDIIDDSSTRRGILKKQAVRREKESGFLRIWRLMSFLVGCFLKFSCLVIILAVISITFVSLYEYLLRSPYIRLEKVIVTGVDEEIKGELLEMSQVNSDQSLLAINLNELKGKLEKHPWIRSVYVEKHFPHTISIRAEKEEPWAIVAADKLYYMNRWGKIFKEVDVGETLDYPIITGVPVRGEGQERSLNSAVLVLSTVESEKGRWSLENLSELHVRGDGSVYLYYSSLPLVIKARATDLGSRLDDLKRVIEHLNRTGRMRSAKGINLDYADGAVVSFKRDKGSEKG